MSDIAIRVEGLSKRYRIGAAQAPYKTIRESLGNLVKAPLRRLRNTQHSDTIWALKDVSFEVKRGEVVGIIGRNGAGKSTLLKILSRITEPTEGSAEIHGRVGSLLEVGTGFHPELTGRENIFLNGAILGMRKAEITGKFDEIVAFAEVEKFIDIPVKHYSSGMYVRLAFAVAAHMETEILLVDEVLAVGDASFQKKCLGKMGEMAHGGRTVLFVSHNMAAVQTMCGRTLLLDQGAMVMDDSTPRTVHRYLSQFVHHKAERVWNLSSTKERDEPVALRSIRIVNASGKITSNLRSDESFQIQVRYLVMREETTMGVTLVLINQEGTIIFSSLSNLDSEWHGKRRSVGVYSSNCVIPKSFLADGQYSVTVLLWGQNYSAICREESAISFSIADCGEVRGDYLGGWSGVVRVRLTWSTEQLTFRQATDGEAAT